MAKNDRKKKNASKKNPAQIEQERRRRLNEWMDLVRRVCVSAGAGPLFDTLTAEERSAFEDFRVPPLEMRKAPGSKVPSEIYHIIEVLFRTFLQQDLVTIPPGNDQVPLGQYLRVIDTLQAVYATCEREKWPRRDRWIEVLSPLVEFVEDDPKRANPMLRMIIRMNQIAAMVGDQDKMVYSIRMCYELKPNPNILMFQWFEVSTIPAEHRHFMIGSQRRRAFRLYSQPMQELPFPAVLSTAWIPHLRDQPERDLPVYTQDHARQRMLERLAPISSNFVDYLLGCALLGPEPLLPMGNGSFLICMDEFGCRLGYLVAEVVRDVGEDAGDGGGNAGDGGENAGEAVLIRTFLFVTQAGTPEGDRLSARLRLGKYEKTYFELDRMGPFMTTDLCHDPVLQEILESCGLGNLVEFAQSGRARRNTVQTQEGYAEKLRHWLNLDAPHKKATKSGAPKSTVAGIDSMIHVLSNHTHRKDIPS